jgi:AraC family transcriptional regulator
MEFKIITKPAFQILGYELRTTNQEGKNNRDIPEFWQRYLQQKWGEKLMEWAISTAEYGICDKFDMATGDFSYIIGMEVRDLAEVPEGLILRQYPEATYAVFTTPKVPIAEFTQSIQSTWKAIFEVWFPHSGYEHAGAAEFELYDERCWTDRNELLEMDIYLPVKAKEQ